MKPFSPVFSLLAVLAVSACVQQPPAARKPVQQQPGPLPKPAASMPMPRPEPAIPANVPTVKIALLLPLSGDGQALGSTLMDAAQLALYDSYVSLPPDQVKAKIVLIPKDTGSSPTIAAEVAKQALDQGAELIIGPLYSQSVSAVAPVAQARRVTVIALSNNRAVAGNGVFVYGFLPEEQVKRVADYAAGRQIMSYASITPNDPYGVTVTEALQKAVTTRGGALAVDEHYAKTPSNMLAASERVSQQAATKPFKALFVAEGAEQAKMLVDDLQAKGLDRAQYQLLGTGLWDEDGVGKLPELRGGWFASASPAQYDKFERRFTAAYGYKPKRLGSLAYDAVTLAVEMAQASGRADFSPSSFTRSTNLQGPANGTYRMREDGVTERSLAVMEVSPVGARVLDPAPRILPDK